MGSNQPTIAEKEYQELQRLILTSTLRMGTDMNTLRTDSSFYTKRKISNSYANTISLLNNGTLSGDKHNTQ
ncbi:TPA: hypothetical protein DEP21_01345 [Patescibacteria group bacterium]|nr:hypothetical protein [Candidatus Gracilibacteria bacterium]